MAIPLSVTISKEQNAFLEENGSISPSKLLQKAIDEEIEHFKINEKFVQEQGVKIRFLQDTIAKQRDFIESQGLMDKFLNIEENV